MLIQASWKPSLRTCKFYDKPDWLPDEIYAEALAAKRNYNEKWEFWVWNVSKDFNVSQAKAEDACIRGIKKEIDRMYFVYGDKIGKWFEEFLEMGDIFTKVKIPIYQKIALGD